LLDWHHDDYPAFGDRIHPMRDNEEYRNKTYHFDNYIEYMHGQVRELCTNYGKIDIMWFDFSYDDLTGEKWRATELVNMVRSLQPDILLDNRLDAGGDASGSIKSKNPAVYSGDFASPEQVIPPSGVVDFEGGSIPWEVCITMNNNWGYNSQDKNYKSARLIIRKLVECVSKNGNMLLNIGPNAKGEIPEQSIKILSEIGKWMKQNGKGLYKCGISEFAKPEWGYYTQNGKLLYAHIFEGNVGPLCVLPEMAGKIKRLRLISDSTEIKALKPWNTYEYPDDIFINFGPVEHFTYSLPDETDTVVEIELL
jgi:alpha-L-fucosidase